MSIGRFRRKLDQNLIAQVLAVGIKPHKRSFNRNQDPVRGAPLVRPVIIGRWPDPIYRRRLEMKRVTS